MEKHNLEKMDLDIYNETLENGLQVFVVPKDNVNGYYVTFSTKYGSIQDEFIPIGKDEMIKVPMGIAHFLEHKVFEQKDGKDPFTFYSERGCDANANTSNYKTTYLFSGTSFLNDGLNYLLDYVQSPYFTDETVNKEKGILEQEIKMYDDSPFYKLYDGIVYNAFVSHPIKYPIAGTIESINQITKDDLYTCYNTFYHPSNMFLVITGNVDPVEVIDLIKLNQSKKKFLQKQDITLKKYEESNEVAIPFKRDYFDVQIPKMAVGYKINIGDLDLNINDFKIYLGLLFNIKFGSTSEFCEQLKEEKLITSDMDISIINTDKHVFVILMNESDNVNEVIKRIDEEIKNMHVGEEDFNRKIKVRKSESIFKSDNIYALNNKIMSNIINYDEIIYDEYKKIEKLTFKQLNVIISQLDLSNKTIYIIDKSLE